MTEKKAEWTKTEKEAGKEVNLWSKKDLLSSASEFVYVDLRDREIVCKRINKEEEIEIQKKTVSFNAVTGELSDIDAPKYQLEIMFRALVKPKMTEQELLQMDSTLFNEMFVAYQKAIGLGQDTQENL